jgi:hypothetical protein
MHKIMNQETNKKKMKTVWRGGGAHHQQPTAISKQNNKN